MGGRGLGSSGLGFGPVAGCCEHGNDWWLLKKDTAAAWSSFVAIKSEVAGL